MKKLKIIIVDCGSSKTKNIAESLATCACETQLILLDEANDFHFNAFDAIVISGGPKLFTDPFQLPELKRQFTFIANLKKPTLGICLGHQAIGLSFGSNIFMGEARRSQETIQKIQAHPLLTDLPETFLMNEDHCEGISLPAGFCLLASSDFYTVEAMACDASGFYGVQFHPEVSMQNGQVVIRNFCQIVRDFKP